MCLVVAVCFSPTMRSDFSHPKLDDDRRVRCSPFHLTHGIVALFSNRGLFHDFLLYFDCYAHT